MRGMKIRNVRRENQIICHAGEAMFLNFFAPLYWPTRTSAMEEMETTPNMKIMQTMPTAVTAVIASVENLARMTRSRNIIRFEERAESIKGTDMTVSSEREPLGCLVRLFEEVIYDERQMRNEAGRGEVV